LVKEMRLGVTVLLAVLVFLRLGSMPANRATTAWRRLGSMAGGGARQGEARLGFAGLGTRPL
jgi:hypothetical protein